VTAGEESKNVCVLRYVVGAYSELVAACGEDEFCDLDGVLGERTRLIEAQGLQSRGHGGLLALGSYYVVLVEADEAETVKKVYVNVEGCGDRVDDEVDESEGDDAREFQTIEHVMVEHAIESHV
jgi:hypothetical protein